MTEPSIKNTPAPRKINGAYILVGLMLVMAVIAYRSTIATIECTADIIETKPDVIMLGTTWCPYCAEARKYFHKNNVHYCEYDIERSAEGKRLYAESNGGGIPILIIDDKKYSGFSAVAFERLMKSREIL